MLYGSRPTDNDSLWNAATVFDDISIQTKTNYETCWKKITEYPLLDLPQTQIKLITTAELRELLNYYGKPRTDDDKEIKPLSKSYITKIKALLTQLYRYAMENNIVDRNYAELVKSPKMEEKKKRAFTDMEFAILEKGYAAIPGGDAVYALCYLGFRVSEFCALTIFSYDPINHTLTGGMETDAGKDRIVPVHPKIRSIVAQWAKSNTGALYPNRSGNPYDKDSFRKRVWNPVMKKLGLPDDLTPHSARHTCGTIPSAGGARPEDIQRILGHEDYSVTANTYINQDLHALEEAIKKWHNTRKNHVILTQDYTGFFSRCVAVASHRKKSHFLRSSLTISTTAIFKHFLTKNLRFTAK